MRARRNSELSNLRELIEDIEEDLETEEGISIWDVNKSGSTKNELDLKWPN